MKENLKKVIDGELIFVDAEIALNNVNYFITFPYKVFDEKGGKIIKGTRLSYLTLLK